MRIIKLNYVYDIARGMNAPSDVIPQRFPKIFYRRDLPNLKEKSRKNTGRKTNSNAKKNCKNHTRGIW